MKQEESEIERLWLEASKRGYQLRLLSIDGEGHQWICQHPTIGVIVWDAIDISREEAMAYALEDCELYLS